MLLLVLQVLLKVAKGLLVEKLESTLIEQLEEAVHRREILYVSCYTRVRCEARGRSTKAATAATATGGEATRRGVAISGVCGGGAAATRRRASRGAACVRS